MMGARCVRCNGAVPRGSDVLKDFLLTFRDKDSGSRPWQEIASCEPRTWESREGLPKSNHLCQTVSGSLYQMA